MTGEEDQKKRKERKTEFIPLRCLPILFFIFNILYTFYRTLKSYKQKTPSFRIKIGLPAEKKKKNSPASLVSVSYIWIAASEKTQNSLSTTQLLAENGSQQAFRLRHSGGVCVVMCFAL